MHPRFRSNRPARRFGPGAGIALVAVLVVSFFAGCRAPDSASATAPPIAGGPRTGPFDGQLLDIEILGRLLWWDAERAIGVMEFTHPRVDPAPGLRVHSYNREGLRVTAEWEISAIQQPTAIGLRLLSGSPEIGDVLAR